MFVMQVSLLESQGRSNAIFSIRQSTVAASRGQLVGRVSRNERCGHSDCDLRDLRIQTKIDVNIWIK